MCSGWCFTCCSTEERQSTSVIIYILYKAPVYTINSRSIKSRSIWFCHTTMGRENFWVLFEHWQCAFYHSCWAGWHNGKCFILNSLHIFLQKNRLTGRHFSHNTSCHLKRWETSVGTLLLLKLALTNLLESTLSYICKQNQSIKKLYWNTNLYLRNLACSNVWLTTNTIQTYSVAWPLPAFGSCMVNTVLCFQSAQKQVSREPCWMSQGLQERKTNHSSSMILWYDVRCQKYQLLSIVLFRCRRNSEHLWALLLRSRLWGPWLGLMTVQSIKYKILP